MTIMDVKSFSPHQNGEFFHLQEGCHWSICSCDLYTWFKCFYFLCSIFIVLRDVFFFMWEADVIAQSIWREGLAWEIYFIFLCILIRLEAETNDIFWTKTNFVKILLIFILPFIKKSYEWRIRNIKSILSIVIDVYFSTNIVYT